MSQEVFLPNELKEHNPVNPKLGIKSSLPKIDELIILTILLWKVNNGNTELTYSYEDGNAIKIDNDVLNKILDFFNSETLSLIKESNGSAITITPLSQSDIVDKINDNPLFTAQFEHIFVALSLFLKIATIKFINDSFPDGKERTGGRRYQKKLEFTVFIDIIDTFIESNIEEFKALCLNVVMKKDVKINSDYYKSLKKMLTVFTENTIFKLRKDTSESIFNQEGIYSLLSEDKDVLAKDTREDVGTVRILKSYVNSSLNPYMKIQSNIFKKESGVTNEFLIEYVKRINNYLEITPIKFDLPHSSTTTASTSQEENSEEHEFGSYDYKNMLLKGVPGTGKSHRIDDIIENKLKIINSKNKLRINIHAASSNSDLIQGIGINSDDGNIKYLEKQGIILNFIINAIMNPDEPFALVLEEIQENSLNELVGDLIYLLEESKRTDIRKEIDNAGLTLSNYEDYQDLLDELIEKNPKINHVQIPYLIESETKFRNFVLPDNLYLFLTSNYRDDKKVIEDNLLRRITTFEIFPKYKDTLGEHFKNEEVSKFLKQLNDSILNQFENREVHPDRFLIGHANWLKVETEKKFYESLLKVIIEFQDIKELYYSDVHDILKGIENYPSFLEEEIDNKIKDAKRYFDIIELLQDKIL